ncbi:MAG TPA: hypothetical protein VLF87_00825 [Patescibacteria group bacterium]|nr:hypothetical protein [Patescibacteria group bacterium]
MLTLGLPALLTIVIILSVLLLAINTLPHLLAPAHQTVADRDHQTRK